MPVNSNPAHATNTSEETPHFAQNAVAEKWGSALTAGYQVIPNVLVAAQSRLELDAVDCMILLNLNSYWWKKNDLPYPPPALIAQRMGVSRRTVERRLLRLEAKGWLKRLPSVGREGQPKIRKYDLSGMVRRLQDAAMVGLSQRGYRAAHRSERNRLLGDSSKAERRKQLLLKSGEDGDV